MDGYLVRSRIGLTLDLQESRRVFAVTATDPAAAQAWWDANTRADCSANGPVEGAVQGWFEEMGGRATAIGTYDVYGALGWHYVPFYT